MKITQGPDMTPAEFDALLASQMPMSYLDWCTFAGLDPDDPHTELAWERRTAGATS